MERQFTTDQKKAFDALCAGKNVFLTGEAGTGKSYVADAFIEWCEKNNRKVLALAPTGIAALNLRNGSTIHRGLGLPASLLAPDEPITEIKGVLYKADVVIIDEVSMCRIDLFERAAKMILAAQEKSTRKQVVVVGDFFQLPPVVRKEDQEFLAAWYPNSPSGYCFPSPYWESFAFENHALHDIVRQKTDPEFMSNLNLARSGTPSCIAYFNQHSIRADNVEQALAQTETDAIWLCPTNRMADTINEMQVQKLEGEPCLFEAQEWGVVNQGDKPTGDKIVLKEGARVMALVNDMFGRYCNGSMGTVVELDSDDGARVRFDNGDTCFLGWHEWEISKPVLVPADGDVGEKIEQEVIGGFTQLPLKVAYAVTIHKSQGQTFEKVALGTQVFDAGQLYVGLSRCQTFDGFRCYPEISNSALRANLAVTDFYACIDNKN